MGGDKPATASPPPSAPVAKAAAKPVTPPQTAAVTRQEVAVAPLSAPPPAAAPAPAVAPAVAAPAPAPALPPPLPNPQGSVQAALLLPMSGQYQALGQALANAAQLALFETAGQNFALLPFDTKGTPDGAAAAAQMALAQGADVILGPLFAFEVRAVAPLAAQQQVPLLAFTTDRSAVGSGTYALGLLPQQQVSRVIAYAHSQGKTRFAVLAPQGDYGQAVIGAAQAAVAAVGAQMVKVQMYDPQSTDHIPMIKRFTDHDARKAALTRERSRLEARGDRDGLKLLGNAQSFGDPPYDAVLIADEGTRLKSLASLLTYFETDMERVRLLGTMLWDDAKLGEEPALVGGWFAAPSSAGHQEFEARYAKAFGALAPRLGGLASVAYDATALAAALARQGYGGFPAPVLTNANGFAGIDGVFRLLPDGTNERGLAVREVLRQGSKEISPAPASFLTGAL